MPGYLQGIFVSAAIPKNALLNERPFETAFFVRGAVTQGRNEVRWRPVKDASLAPPCSNLRSFGSKCTSLKKVLVTLLGPFGVLIVIRRPGNCAPLPPSLRPCRHGFHHMPEHQKGASDQSTLVIGLACCFMLQDLNVESSYLFSNLSK